MSIPTCDIRRSEKGPYYEMKIDGKFAGNYDSVAEAAYEYEEMKRKEKEKNEQSVQV